MKKLFIIISCIALLAGLGGCKKERVSSASQPAELTIFAAASLTEALTEISELYIAANPGTKINFNFDSSGKLQTQIENGAEADLFISAGVRQMDAIPGYIDAATRKDLLVNNVVLIVPKGSTKGISSFEDCLTSKVSLIALGNESVPVGQYSQEIFEYLKGWNTVVAKASLGSNVKEVLSQVESASVDCGVVYSTDAATAKGVQVVASSPAGSHSPVIYPAAVLKGSVEPEAAKAFLDYLSSPGAVAVFEKIGFGVIK
jgi:molybdate transport system substrate-binding protein